MHLDKAKHKTLLLQILKDIYSNPDLGAILGFKGGTAAFMFYELPRFSVDLDFDLLDETKKQVVFDALIVILKKYGQLKKQDQKRFTLFFLLSYGELAYNIKIEVNLRQFGSRYQVKHYFGVPMKVMHKEDMFANKLVAFLERKGETNRDIYDVWFFLDHRWSINKDIVEKRRDMTFSEAVESCLSLLETIPNRGILSGIGELLTDAQKQWVKKSLLKDVIFLLRCKQSE